MSMVEAFQQEAGAESLAISGRPHLLEGDDIVFVHIVSDGD